MSKIYTLEGAKNLIVKIKRVEVLVDGAIIAYNQGFRDSIKFIGENVNVAELTMDDANDYIY